MADKTSHGIHTPSLLNKEELEYGEYCQDEALALTPDFLPINTVSTALQPYNETNFDQSLLSVKDDEDPLVLELRMICKEIGLPPWGGAAKLLNRLLNHFKTICQSGNQERFQQLSGITLDSQLSPSTDSAAVCERAVPGWQTLSTSIVNLPSETHMNKATFYLVVFQCRDDDKRFILKSLYQFEAQSPKTIQNIFHTIPVLIHSPEEILDKKSDLKTLRGLLSFVHYVQRQSRNNRLPFMSQIRKSLRQQSTKTVNTKEMLDLGWNAVQPTSAQVGREITSISPLRSPILASSYDVFSLFLVSIEPNVGSCRPRILPSIGTLENDNDETTTLSLESKDPTPSADSITGRLLQREDNNLSSASLVELARDDYKDNDSDCKDHDFGTAIDDVSLTDLPCVSPDEKIDSLYSCAYQQGETLLPVRPIGSRAEFNSEDLPFRFMTEPTANPLSSNSRDTVSMDLQCVITTAASEESFDSDLFSISDSSDEMEPPDTNESAHLFLDAVLRNVLLGFRTVVQHQLSPSKESACSVPPANTSGFSARGEAAGSVRKRNRQAAEDDNEDDDDQDDFLRRPRKRTNPSKEKSPQRLFACPFLKFSPLKHAGCCAKQLRRIRDVKQHLARKHTPDRYCQRCLATTFEDEDSLDRHVNLNACSYRDKSYLGGVSHEQARKLSKKSNRSLEEKDQWFAIWDILFPESLFPDIIRPASAYMDIGLSMEMQLFRNYCSAQGPTILREHIETDSAWLVSEISEEQRRVYLNRVCAQGINRLFEQYLLVSPPSGFFGNARPPLSRLHNHMQPTTNSTSSIADSGVALGSHNLQSQSTSREDLQDQTPNTLNTAQGLGTSQHQDSLDSVNSASAYEEIGENLMDGNAMGALSDQNFQSPFDFSLLENDPVFNFDEFIRVEA